jgi:hypothetical protein
MASLTWLRHKLNAAIVAGDQVAIKRIKAQIKAEEQKRGKGPRKGL